MGNRARTALLVAALVGASTACGAPPEAAAAHSPFEELVADSLAGDSAAFAALPDPLVTFLDVRRELAERTEGVTACTILPSRHDRELRRRMRFTYPDRSSAVLYAVADDSSGGLERVEFLRRVPGQGQRGLIWDGEHDRTTSTWWTESTWGLSRRAERGEIPRGGPVPRVLRGLARQMMLGPCEADKDTPTRP